MSNDKSYVKLSINNHKRKDNNKKCSLFRDICILLYMWPGVLP